MSVTPTFLPSSVSKLSSNKELPNAVLVTSDIVDAAGNATTNEVVFGVTGTAEWLAIYDEAHQTYDTLGTVLGDIASVSHNFKYSHIADCMAKGGQFALTTGSDGNSILSAAQGEDVKKGPQLDLDLGVAVASDSNLTDEGTTLAQSVIADANGNVTQYQLVVGQTGDIGWTAVYDTVGGDYAPLNPNLGNATSVLSPADTQNAVNFIQGGGVFTQVQNSDGSYQLMASAASVAAAPAAPVPFVALGGNNLNIAVTGSGSGLTPAEIAALQAEIAQLQQQLPGLQAAYIAAGKAVEPAQAAFTAAGKAYNTARAGGNAKVLAAAKAAYEAADQAYAAAINITKLAGLAWRSAEELIKIDQLILTEGS